MPYLLVAAATLVGLVGVATLLGGSSNSTTKGAVLMWGLLFGLGVTVWPISARLL